MSQSLKVLYEPAAKCSPENNEQIDHQSVKMQVLSCKYCSRKWSYQNYLTEGERHKNWCKSKRRNKQKWTRWQYNTIWCPGQWRNWIVMELTCVQGTSINVPNLKFRQQKDTENLQIKNKMTMYLCMLVCMYNAPY